MAPGEMLATAAGLPSHMFCPRGREAMSTAFFNAAGTDRLCSGVTNKTASVAFTKARNDSQASGAPAPSNPGCKWQLRNLRNPQGQ